MSNQLPHAEQLALLRAADHERHWYSLDDKRVCVICERIFSGREVEIRSLGSSLSLHCPTEDCASDSHHWLIWQPSPAEPNPAPDVRDGEYSFL